VPILRYHQSQRFSLQQKTVCGAVGSHPALAKTLTDIPGWGVPLSVAMDAGLEMLTTVTAPQVFCSGSEKRKGRGRSRQHSRKHSRQHSRQPSPQY